MGQTFERRVVVGMGASISFVPSLGFRGPL